VPLDSWMGVYLPGDTRVGFVNTTAKPENRNGQVGTAVSVTADLKMTLLMVPMKVFITGTAWMPQERGLAEFDFRLRSSEHTMRVSATIRDGLLDARVFTAGEEFPFQIPVSEDLLLSGGMGTTMLNVPVLRVGEEVTVDGFDPMTFSAGKVKVTCVDEETLSIAGEEVRTKVVTTTLNGLTTKAWVDEHNEIVQADTPFGFSLRKITPEEALRPTGETRTSDLLKVVAIQPVGMKPYRGAKRLSMVLGGLSEGKYPAGDDTQTAIDKLYIITAPPTPEGQFPLAATGFEEELRGDAFVQKDHPKIRDLSAQIVGAEKDAWKRAMLIYEWVYGNIQKEPVFSIPSALEVLETQKGDCNEHTVLYVALARAAGVPARIAIGVVWSDELQGFYYHAWPEVYAGRWIWVDPTLGQPIADATHLKLLNGSIESWPQLIPFIGQLRIEVAGLE